MLHKRQYQRHLSSSRIITFFSPIYSSSDSDGDAASVESDRSSKSDVKKSAALRRKSIQAWQSSLSRAGSVSSLSPRTSEAERPAEVSTSALSAKSRRASLTAVQKWKDKTLAAKVASRRSSNGDVPTDPSSGPAAPATTLRRKSKSTPPIKPRGDSVVISSRKESTDSNWLSDYGELPTPKIEPKAEPRENRENLL